MAPKKETATPKATGKKVTPKVDQVPDPEESKLGGEQAAATQEVDKRDLDYLAGVINKLLEEKDQIDTEVDDAALRAELIETANDILTIDDNVSDRAKKVLRALNAGPDQWLQEGAAAPEPPAKKPAVSKAPKGIKKGTAAPGKKSEKPAKAPKAPKEPKPKRTPKPKPPKVKRYTRCQSVVEVLKSLNQGDTISFDELIDKSEELFKQKAKGYKNQTGAVQFAGYTVEVLTVAGAVSREGDTITVL